MILLDHLLVMLLLLKIVDRVNGLVLRKECIRRELGMVEGHRVEV
jgi:hypothetical protein